VKIYQFVLYNIFDLNMYWQMANLCPLWIEHLSNVIIAVISQSQKWIVHRLVAAFIHIF